MLGSADDPLGAQVIRPLPYTAPSGRFHSSIRMPQWVSNDSLVYLAELLFYEGSTFLPDTFYTGADVVLLDLAAGTPGFNVLPGTDYASSVSLSDEPGMLYYTLGGDSRVYRRALSSGDVTVIHDFGSGNIVRDVQVRGRTLVAVVGRSVLYRFEDAHGSRALPPPDDLARRHTCGSRSTAVRTGSCRPGIGVQCPQPPSRLVAVSIRVKSGRSFAGVILEDEELFHPLCHLLPGQASGLIAAGAELGDNRVGPLGRRLLN
jgi:hypothetical protein